MRCFVTRRLPGPAWTPRGIEVDVFERDFAAPRDQLLERAAKADAVITLLSNRVDESFFQACPSVRIVANYAVGVDNIDLDSARRHGVWVTHTPDVLTNATADLTWALLLGVARRIQEGDALVRSGRPWAWAPDLLLGAELSGATLGIIGMGRIGQAVARRAEAFGMRVLGRRRSSGPELEMLLEHSDVVSLHAPLTEETRHLIDASALRRMKRSAILINTARGPLVDEAALVAALESGEIAGAGLDVYEEEPKPHPGLLDRPDVLLLPHIGSATFTARGRMAAMNFESVEAALRGDEPPHLVPGPKEHS